MADQLPGGWALAGDGIEDARRLGLSLRDVVGDGAVTVVCSTERKAIETAEALGVGNVHHDQRLREVDRPWYDRERSFEVAVRHYLTGVPMPGWEPLDDAVARFGFAISDRVGTCIVVSHGTVMSAWLGQQMPDLDAVNFWDQLRMPDAWLIDLNTETVLRIADHDDQ